MKRKFKYYLERVIDNYERIAPECPLFGTCGGCSLSYLSYEDQVRLKKGFVEEIFKDLYKGDIEFVPSPREFFYRNRMDFVTAFGKTGLRKPGNFKDVVKIDRCLLLSEESNEFLKHLNGAIAAGKVGTHNCVTHKGFLRYFVVREAKFTGQNLVNFISFTDEEEFRPYFDEFCEAFAPTSALWSLRKSRGDDSKGEEVIASNGVEEIQEDINGRRYIITADSFFQSNPYLTGQLFDKVASYVKGRTVDLFSGVGSISVYVAPAADSVFGVELSPEMVGLARRNAELNGVENVEFECRPAQKVYPYPEAETYILDPPRSAIARKIIERLLKASPERIVYVSCNPVELAVDARDLSSQYRIKELTAFDMFCQTPHVECLAIFVKK